MPKIVYVPKKFGAAAMEKIALANAIVEEYAAQGFDLTLRQLYYQFVSRDYIRNNINEYKNLGSLINDARLAGYIDWTRIVDRTRNLRKLSSWEDPASIISGAAYSYKQDLWRTQDYRIEVWIEKNALIGVIEPICDSLRVPYFACVGYTSQSEMWGAAQRLRRYIEEGKTPVILHLGDHDPSGQDMTRDIQERLDLFLSVDLRKRGRRFGGLSVNRLALNMDQVETYNPPPNPTKFTDSRASGYIQEFGYESWELDALSPTVIAEIIETNVKNLRDEERWDDAVVEEQLGKSLLQKTSDNWDTVVETLDGFPDSEPDNDEYEYGDEDRE